MPDAMAVAPGEPGWPDRRMRTDGCSGVACTAAAPPSQAPMRSIVRDASRWRRDRMASKVNMNPSGRQSMGTRQHVDPERPVHALTGPVSRRIYTEPVAVASSPGRGLLEGASVRVREVMSRGRGHAWLPAAGGRCCLSCVSGDPDGRTDPGADGRGMAAGAGATYSRAVMPTPA